MASTDSDITWEVILCAGVTASLIGDRVIHSMAYGAVRANNMYKITLIRYIPDTVRHFINSTDCRGLSPKRSFHTGFSDVLCSPC